jgi:type IV pilus biogenesis protein CpaD/CtpE
MRYLAIVLLLAGCASHQPSFESALGSAYLTVTAIADGVYDACEAETLGGPCAEDALITTEQRDEARALLADALALLDESKRLWVAGSADLADGSLAAARRSIQLAQGVVRGIE